MSTHAQHMLDLLRGAENKPKAAWLENYVKHDIKSLGVGIPEIRMIIKAYEKEHAVSRQPLPDQHHFLDHLMQQEYTESKLAAILFMQLFWKTAHPPDTLLLTARWFDQQLITDWNVCDWLCVRLLSPLLDTAPEESIPAFNQWNQSPLLWKARASLVPFTQCKTLASHGETILPLAATLIRREERFCKTAVGWVLREYSRIDEKYVRDFLERYKNRITPEVLKNATKYLK